MEEQYRLMPLPAKAGPLSAKDIDVAAMPCWMGDDYPSIGMLNLGSLPTQF